MKTNIFDNRVKLTLHLLDEDLFKMEAFFPFRFFKDDEIDKSVFINHRDFNNSWLSKYTFNKLKVSSVSLCFDEKGFYQDVCIEYIENKPLFYLYGKTPIYEEDCHPNFLNYSPCEDTVNFDGTFYLWGGLCIHYKTGNIIESDY